MYRDHQNKGNINLRPSCCLWRALIKCTLASPPVLCRFRLNSSGSKNGKGSVSPPNWQSLLKSYFSRPLNKFDLKRPIIETKWLEFQIYPENINLQSLLETTCHFSWRENFAALNRWIIARSFIKLALCGMWCKCGVEGIMFCFR